MWTCIHTWKRSSINTLWCLFGCSIGDLGTIWFFQNNHYEINDLEIMKRVGFSATPKNGIEKIKNISDYICESNGGDGVFREITELIISFKK